MQSDFSAFFHFRCIMLTNHFFKKSRKKVPQENQKWTFLKCPKWKFSEYFFKQLFITPYNFSYFPVINLPN